MQNQADLVRALAVLAETARHAGEMIAQSLPGDAEQPEQFEHTDEDGDTVVMGEHHLPGWLRASVNDRVVHLSPEAVNGLARYLDRYRTDTPCPGKPGELRFEDQCAGIQHHDGPCSPDADMIGAPTVDLDQFYCAGYDSEQPPRKSGCGHPRQAHGSLGCNISHGDATQCPCERRGGQ